MPLPFIIGAIGAIGSAAGAVGTAVVGTAATVGTAVAGTAATVGTAAAAVGTATVVSGAAAKVYCDIIKEDARFEGKIDGYCEASKEYEQKFIELTNYFLTEKKVLADRIDDYEQLLEIYKETIQKLEQMVDKSEETIQAMNSFKITYFDLINLEKVE